MDLFSGLKTEKIIPSNRRDFSNEIKKIKSESDTKILTVKCQIANHLSKNLKQNQRKTDL